MPKFTNIISRQNLGPTLKISSRLCNNNNKTLICSTFSAKLKEYKFNGKSSKISYGAFASHKNARIFKFDIRILDYLQRSSMLSYKIRFEIPATVTNHDMAVAKQLLLLETNLATKLEQLEYDDSVCVYNPLHYALKLHSDFINKFANISPKTVLFLGMNPGCYYNRVNNLNYHILSKIYQCPLSRALGNGTNRYTYRVTGCPNKFLMTR